MNTEGQGLVAGESLSLRSSALGTESRDAPHRSRIHYTPLVSLRLTVGAGLPRDVFGSSRGKLAPANFRNIARSASLESQQRNPT